MPRLDRLSELGRKNLLMLPVQVNDTAPFTPLWETFLARRATVRDQEAAQELRWAFEELRVAIFAPEVTTPVSVTVAKVGAALAALR